MKQDSTSETAERNQLRAQCRSLRGYGQLDVPAELQRVANWCREQKLDADRYGSGDFLQGFEARVASMLGFEAGRFMPSGTMAQAIALRIWCDAAGRPEIGLHPTSHLELHEHHAYAHLHGLRATLLGDATRPPCAGDLAGTTPEPAAWVVELPTRENGGQLPDWEQLGALHEAAHDKNVRVHLDGARLWEAQAHYDRPLASICAGFDSAYVSFYKSIGALPGAMLLGPGDFIEEAAIWQRRQGGNLCNTLPAAASAAMRLDDQLSRMAAHRDRARSIAKGLSGLAGMKVLPDPPQVNMFHVRFDASPEAVLRSRDHAARQTGLWLLDRATQDDGPHTARTEMVIADGAQDTSDEAIVEAFGELSRHLVAHA